MFSSAEAKVLALVKKLYLVILKRNRYKIHVKIFPSFPGKGKKDENNLNNNLI